MCVATVCMVGDSVAKLPLVRLGITQEQRMRCNSPLEEEEGDACRALLHSVSFKPCT